MIWKTIKCRKRTTKEIKKKRKKIIEKKMLRDQKEFEKKWKDYKNAI